MSEFYNRGGERISLFAWGRLLESRGYKRVALFEDKGLTVSTVWVGLDHGYGDTSCPLIFETMAWT